LTYVSLALGYLVALVVATWPSFTTLASTLPSRVDPVIHIWTMRWNKQCLLEGRLPFLCPDLQYPTGAALGTLPPMHFQSLLYIPLSFLTDNDILCYNLIRTFAFLLTGLGTFRLAWEVTRSRLASALAGLTAMLGTPMLFFSHGELEQITVGWFPLFLVAWLRFVDRPSRGRLFASTVLYLLVAMSAPYFGVFAVFPASLYVAWRGIEAGRTGFPAWIRLRWRWFAGFVAMVAPAVGLLFSSQIWALRHGFSMARPEAEFALCRAPLWGYLVPCPWHALSKILPFDTTVAIGFGPVPSYLGIVTLGLVVYAAVARVRFPRAMYWWAVSALLLVLSMGAVMKVGGTDVSLPAAWLKAHFVGFRMLRVPARFNLFASVAIAILAAAGLRDILAKVNRRATRAAIASLLALVVLLDLSTVPYGTIDLPPMPACYRAILDRDPDATFVEVPQFNSGAFQLPALCSYWQSLHHGKTSSGYTAFLNGQHDNLLGFSSPFDAFKLAQPNYLANPAVEDFELIHGLDFRSYVWLYLHVHKLRYVVVHHRPGAFPELPVRLDRLETELASAKVYEDADTAVFDRDRLPKPTHPVMVHAQGFGPRVIRFDQRTCLLRKSAQVVVYNPTPEIPLSFTLGARSNKVPRQVSLTFQGRELGRSEVGPREAFSGSFGPFTLPEGLSELTLMSDGEETPSKRDAHVEGDSTPFSLWVTSVGLSANPPAIAARPTRSRP
jgi:hypothetical protein